VKQFIYISPINKISQILREKLYINAVYMLIVNVFPGIIGAFFWMVAGNLYGERVVGLASAVLSAVSLVAMLANLGLSTSLIRFLPETKDKARLLKTAYSLVLIASLLLDCIYLLGAPIWAHQLISELNNATFIGLFLIFTVVTSFGGIVRDTFLAFREAKYACFYTIIAQILRIVLLFSCVYLGTLGLIMSNAIAFAMALTVSILIFLKIIFPSFSWRFELNLLIIKQIIPYSIGNHLTNVLISVQSLVFPMIILELLGPVSSAHAYIPLILGGMILAPGSALASSAFTESTNDLNNADRILKKTGLISALLSFLIGSSVLILGPSLLSLFGKGYATESVRLLRLLSLASPFISFNQAYFTYLRTYKRLRLLMTLNIFLTASILSLAWMLLPQIGIEGCGYSILTCNILIDVFIFLFEFNKRR